MSLRVCLDCTTAFAVGVPRCPHCRSERHAEKGSAAALGVYASVRFEEGSMPKITKHGGPSVAGEHGPETVEFADNAAVHPAGEGSEQSSPGSSSETSPEKQRPKQKQSGAGRQRRARTTESHSGPSQAEASDARSTGGGGPSTPDTSK